jgi:glucose uptake protein GlcU
MRIIDGQTVSHVAALKLSFGRIWATGCAFILTAEQTNGNESHSRSISQIAAGFCYDIHPAG